MYISNVLFYSFTGASSGNVAENVILERESETTITFADGARTAYLGYMTVKFSPDVTSAVPHHKHYCLEVGEQASPTIEHVTLRSTSVGKYHSNRSCPYICG